MNYLARGGCLEEGDGLFHDVVFANEDGFWFFENKDVWLYASGLNVGAVSLEDAHGSESHEDATRERKIGDGAERAGGRRAEKFDVRSDGLEHCGGVFAVRHGLLIDECDDGELFDQIGVCGGR